MSRPPSPQDAIVAVASPPGRSPRGLLRLSGPDLRPLAERLLGGPLPERELTDARLRWPTGDPSPLAEPLSLPCLALFFAGPRSFTGEDVLEIQTPGNPALLDRLLHLLLDRENLRLAEPGEFTQRAFTAGRIDLTRAEGIAATIGAVSDAQLQAAGLLRRGKLGRWAEHLVEDLAQSLALVEAGIDFVDQEDVVPITPAALDDRLAALTGELDRLLHRSRAWSVLESPPWVVLVGRPNVGKSTLFNALLGRERAVTSAMAGTTRDVLTEPLRLTVHGRDVEVMLVDLAGLELADDDLAAAMQTAADDAIQRAELLLILTDGDDRAEAIPPDRLAAGTPRIIVGAKADAVTHDRTVDLAVSAATGAGLDDLRAAIADRLADRAVSLGGEMLALQPRHTDALRQARAALREARRMLAPQLDQPDLADLEIVAATLRHALDQLGRLGGRMTPDEVIGRVFATFCVGK